MKHFVPIALLSILMAIAFTYICPEEPAYIPYQSVENDGKDTVRFLGGDGRTMLTGHWYLPKDHSANVPVILLAHGLGLIQGKSLDPFVNAFQSAKFAVVTFDYATFGQSDGIPRHQVNPKSHIKDIHSAIAMIKEEGKQRNVDTTRIGLWGTSLAGGHVLMATAAEADPAIRVVISQVAHIASGFESVLGSLATTPLKSAKGIIMFMLGLVRWAMSKMMNKEAYFPIVGEPGSASFMQNPGDLQGYLGVLNPASELGSGWKNAATTDSGLRILFYRPLSSVDKIKVPVLLIAAENDALCPAKFIQLAKDRIQSAEIIILPNVGHFDIYRGKELKTVISAEVNFFRNYLKT